MAILKTYKSYFTIITDSRKEDFEYPTTPVDYNYAKLLAKKFKLEEREEIIEKLITILPIVSITKDYTK